MSSIMQNKQALRQELLARRKSMPKAVKQGIEAQMQAHILADAVFQAAKVVSFYVSMPLEWDTRELIACALAQGKTVCVPRCEKGGLMHMHQIDALGQAAQVSGFGVCEPAASRPLMKPRDIDCMLVPALACDAQGHRLGYGMGYYDRYLTQTCAQTIALCAQQDLLGMLPTECFDVPCKKVITEAQVLNCDEK